MTHYRKTGQKHRRCRRCTALRPCEEFPGQSQICVTCWPLAERVRVIERAPASRSPSGTWRKKVSPEQVDLVRKLDAMHRKGHAAVLVQGVNWVLARGLITRGIVETTKESRPGRWAVRLTADWRARMCFELSEDEATLARRFEERAEQ